MGIIDYSAARELLITARGHPYPRDAFAAMFEGLKDWRWSIVEQPAAQRLIGPECIDHYNAIVCYDMPGVDFTSKPMALPVAPREADKARMLQLLDIGMGFVFLHHSIAAWPTWPEYAEIVGGRFHYRPAPLRGRDWPDSGYRHQVTHNVSVLQDHPVTAGVPAQFSITDELYLGAVFEDDVIPLLGSDYDFSAGNFYSATLAAEGRMFCNEGWEHPRGSSLVGWVKHYRNSPIVYLQGGDDAIAMENPHLRQLLHNAIAWVASEEAHTWARERNKTRT